MAAPGEEKSGRPETGRPLLSDGPGERADEAMGNGRPGDDRPTHGRRARASSSRSTRRPGSLGPWERPWSAGAAQGGRTGTAPAQAPRASRGANQGSFPWLTIQCKTHFRLSTLEFNSNLRAVKRIF